MIFRKILKVQIYCIAKNGKRCWRQPDALEEQTPADGAQCGSLLLPRSSTVLDRGSGVTYVTGHLK